MSARFRHRGIVEGFYGPPWAHVDRLWWIERLGALGMNCYVPAPKDDPLHREQWRDRPSADALAAYDELVAHGRRHGVRVGCALSPGLSIRYGSAEDVGRLIDKFRLYTTRGAGLAALCLDDVPVDLAHDADRDYHRHPVPR